MQQGEPGMEELVCDRVREALRERLQDALAIRWLLDQPGVSVALLDVRHPQELAPVDGLLGGHLDTDESRASVDRIIAENVKDSVGPEFMAPPEAHAEAV